IHLVTPRKVKEPPTFKGDGSDTVSIQEWEDLMRTFIKRSNLRLEEQAEEILVYLRGKAKDVVRFGIRNADFYTTLPENKENPYDYWLRLNKAADIAAGCLNEQVEDLSTPNEVCCAMQNSQNVQSKSRSEDDMTRVLETLGLTDLDLKSCEVSLEWKDKLLQLIEQYESVFSRHKMDCGEAKGFEHRIHLVDNKPFRLPYRRIPPSHYDKLRTALNEMEEKGIIQKSHSEYASPLVLVWKKNGDLRICTDFRWLNARTVKDAHPLPHQADSLAALGGNAFFSTMDLTSGFYNIPLHEEDRKYTAFSSPFGLHEYTRLPQGLCNSPATFMRMMMSIFGDQNFSSLLCYLDDLLVFAPTEKVALERLQMVLSRLAEHNLKLSPKKCSFLQRSVRFLGHIICEEGVQTDPEKVKVINDIQTMDLMESDKKTPCAKKIRSFLGMVMYYQHFIERCSAKAKPLFKLAVEPATHNSGKRKRKALRKATHVKLSPSDWSTECQEAFEILKHDIKTSVTLAHPNFSEPFILAVDASFDGIGAVLSQKTPAEKIARPVAFASKTLSKSQLNYPAHRLEFLALKWAVCDKFSHWLKGRHFVVWTDNNPLTYILTKPRLDACEQRWISKLASYSFDLKYIPGPKNVVADALSRQPFVQSCVSHRLVSEPYAALLNQVDGVCDSTVQDTFRLSNNCQEVQNQTHDSAGGLVGDPTLHATECSIASDEIAALFTAQQTGGVSRMVGSGAAIPQLLKEDPSTTLPQSQVLALQEQDDTIGRTMFYMQRHRRPNKRERAAEPRSVIKFLKHWNKFTIRNGHQGQSRTLSLARQRFFWSGMERDIVNHVKTCDRCIVEHETTGFAPFYLMFGRIPRLPIDVIFQHALDDNTNVVSHLEFVTHLKRDLSEAAQIVQRNTCREQIRHAKLYDRKVKGSPLAVGDRVLLANRGERGKRKIADSGMDEISTHLDEGDLTYEHNAVVPDEVEGSDKRTMSWLLQCDDADESHVNVDTCPVGSLNLERNTFGDGEL
ncbi:hypothetical protein NFI96_008254, partial [Prochilodus magdalenae]